MSSNTIVLKCNGHREEYKANAALSPGHLLTINSSGECLKHAAAGQRVPVIVAVENALAGKTINDAFASGDRVPVVVGSKGDILQVRLQSGQSASRGDGLVSAGDGTFLVGESGASSVPSGLLFRQVADSTAVVNTGSETLFDQSYTLPANALRAGDVIKVTAQVFVTSVNATPNLTSKLFVGGLAGTAIVDTTALAVVANDIVYINSTITIRTIGSGGTMVAVSDFTVGVPGTATAKAKALASTTINTTVTQVFGIGVTWSAAHASNSCLLRMLNIDLERRYGNPIVYAEETMDASGSEKLLRARVA
jgi:F0F1-type ATP synthase membrane subunit c/vacuolar-type H+-ATPase subunit K